MQPGIRSAGMKEFYINGIGLLAPGLNDWDDSQSVLSGKQRWQEDETPVIKTDLMSARESRRATPIIKMALQVGQQAVRMAGVDAEKMDNVFASSDGDLFITDRICSELTKKDKYLSPMMFHNSVHNAPAGYWSIGVSSMCKSASISAANASFSAGLLEAMSYSPQQTNDIIVVAYDYPAPLPLSKKRDFAYPFAVALVLSGNKGNNSIASLTMDSIRMDITANGCDDPGLEGLRCHNPAARCLPLLQVIAMQQAGTVALEYVAGSSMIFRVRPC